MVTNLNNKLVIYQSADGSLQLDVKLENETIWLDRYQMSQLFDRDVKTIGKRIANAPKEELDGEGVAEFATPVPQGVVLGEIQKVEGSYYNLDVILSVGYRVK